MSSAEASQWIERYSGQGLDHPPGKKPRTYKRRPAPGVTRMISGDQCEQIIRLGDEYFDGNEAKARNWLLKNFKVHDPRELGTARRGANVIYTLKSMVIRKRNKESRRSAR